MSLAQLARRHSLVVFFHHGDVKRIRAWAEHEGELQALGWMPVSVSAQTPRAHIRLAAGELLGYPLLSDPELRLAARLVLRTMRIPEERVYVPLTLLVRRRRIARAFYPIEPMSEIADVMSWIRRVDGEAEHQATPAHLRRGLP